MRLLLYELRDEGFHLCYRLLQVVVDDDIIETVGIRNLLFGFGYPFLDGFRRIGTPSRQPFAQCGDRGRHDEDGEGVLAENRLEPYSTHDIDVEQDGIAFPPDALHLGLERPVPRPGIDLLPLYEPFLLAGLPKLLGREEIVVAAVLLVVPGLPRSGRDRELQAGKTFRQRMDYRRFAGPGRG